MSTANTSSVAMTCCGLELTVSLAPSTVNQAGVVAHFTPLRHMVVPQRPLFTSPKNLIDLPMSVTATYYLRYFLLLLIAI